MINNITYSILNSNNVVVVLKDIDVKDNFSSKLKEKIEVIQPVEKTLHTRRQNEREDAWIAYNRLKGRRMVLGKLK